MDGNYGKVFWKEKGASDHRDDGEMLRAFEIGVELAVSVVGHCRANFGRRARAPMNNV